MKKSVFDETGRLKEYRRKRNFARTGEPAARSPGRSRKKQPMFVIQKHDATRLHYDFRLEMEGVLKSWAVPRGLPTSRGDKRLAVQVEDHPFAYAQFEGTIPRGQYGGGTVMVWDVGTYSVQNAEPLRGWKEGKLHLTLAGKKLKGDWTFVRMKLRAGEKENWLIFKSGEDMKPISAKKDDESILTGRSMDKIASENKAQWRSHKAAGDKIPERIVKAALKRARPVAAGGSTQKKGAAHRTPVFMEPMKARLVDHLPEGSDWIYEIKFDGFRVLALKDGDDVQLLSRNNKSLNERFPEVVAAVRKLPFERGTVDGEVVALDEEGRSSFQLLQMANMPGQKKSPIVYYLFDVLNLEGASVLELPLRQRKVLLQSQLSEQHEPVRFSASIHGDASRLIAEIKKRGLEGIVAKQVDSPYEPGRRSGCWKKVKVVNEQEFVIGGFTAPKGSRDHFGAILVGYFERSELIFVSKVGSGFNQVLLESLNRHFQKIKRAVCPFANLPEKAGYLGRGLTASEMRKCSWIEPRLVAQIRFSEWTRDNHLRHPVFMGLREDLKAQDVGKERPA